VTEKFLNGPDVVAAFQEMRGDGMTKCWVFPAVFLRKDPLPEPFSGRVEVFTVEGVRQENATPTAGQVALVDCFDFSTYFCSVSLSDSGRMVMRFFAPCLRGMRIFFVERCVRKALISGSDISPEWRRL